MHLSLLVFDYLQPLLLSCIKLIEVTCCFLLFLDFDAAFELFCEFFYLFYKLVLYWIKYAKVLLSPILDHARLRLVFRNDLLYIFVCSIKILKDLRLFKLNFNAGLRLSTICNCFFHWCTWLCRSLGRCISFNTLSWHLFYLLKDLLCLALIFFNCRLESWNFYYLFLLNLLYLF